MPADMYTVHDVAEGASSDGAAYWEILMRRPDGQLHGLAFPKETLEWRAAEYGLSDPAEILDIVVHERFQPRSTVATARSMTGPAAQAKKATAEPVTVWTAKSTPEALAAHRARIAAVKADRVHVTDPRGYLAHITSAPAMTTAGVREKTEKIDTLRWLKRYGGLPADPITTEETTRA